MEDTYRAYYIKEFFKWIGLSYVAVVNKPGRNIFDNEEYYKFDVIVNYNDAIDKDQCQKIEERTKSALVSVDDKDGKSEDTLLQLLVSEIGQNKFIENSKLQDVLLGLACIYIREHMVDLLYEYTFILLQRLPEDLCDNICERCINVVKGIQELEKWQKENDIIEGMEYILYAMYYSMKEVNEFQWIRNKSLIYDTENYLIEVNEIYNYDEGYFKVETLKGRIAEFDSRFSASPKFFLENAIQDCPLKICKSYHFYTWGKWKERNGQPFEASLAYQKAYATDLTNFKAMFKLAVEQKRMDENMLAERFFRAIINELSVLFSCKEQMSLREIEYLYKAFVLAGSVCEPQFRPQYYEKAKQCMDYINSLIENPNQNDFAFNMYQRNPKIKILIAKAMKSRLKNNLWNCTQEVTEEESNGKTEE